MMGSEAEGDISRKLSALKDQLAKKVDCFTMAAPRLMELTL